MPGMAPSADTPALLPLFADLRGRRVLLVGGGEVAQRKLAPLREAGARVRIVAPALRAQLLRLVQAGEVEHRAGTFEPSDLDDAWLVVAATGDAAVNRAVADAAEARRIFANVVDDATLSSWHSPARVRRGPLQVAIASGGGAPMLARHLRERFERELDEALGPLADLLASRRAAIRARFPDPAPRRRFLDAMLGGDVPAKLRAGDADGAAAAFDTALADDTNDTRGGRVALVGAGPGDAGLLTLRALRLLNQADVILHDRLVSADVLALARRDAQLVEVGKQAGHHHVTQDGIHALLLAHARAGRFVVRLKGGDPFVFGRGGEEMEFLRAHGIPYEAVPGVTAALACAAHAGIPLTHRDHAQSLRLVTAHCRESLDALDWPALAQERQTLAVYMGVAGLDRLRDRLLAHGRSPSTPFALVENGTRASQRVVTGTLADLPDIAAAHAVRSPALLIIGEVAALAGTLHWFGAPPLAGLPVASPSLAPPTLAHAASD